ncbi:MAG: hypothetical protein M3305_10370, partial [Actinomycetota bacterium]|nr:hypothetical protein [Actinomycetota bacterium]
VDVLVSTRTAALVPLAALGAVCVVDEPDEGYRASPGYEGVPIHIRELVRARGWIEGAAVFFLSPFPSLKLYAPESGARRLSTVETRRWPAVSMVDMRGTGGLLSRTLLDACRQAIRSEERVGVVARLGSATSVSCNRCGFVPKCPRCDLPLILPGKSSGTDSFLLCRRCDYKEDASEGCRRCDSVRLSAVGLTANRVQAELAKALDADIGLLTADEREREGAPVVVGTARCIMDREWDLITIPDVDSFLFADSAEKGFRLLYRAAEMGRKRLLVQTRSPDDHTLRTALQGNYEAFAAEQLPKRRVLLYPPHAYLAEFAFEGPEEVVRRAIELRLRPALKDGIRVLDPVPYSRSEGQPVWRVLLRSPQRDALAESAAFVARLAAEDRGRNGLKVHINMDPEEV